MLLSFRVANHRSIREEQQLNLAPVYDADRPAGTRWEAVPVAALFGANGAGKSNVVHALGFMAEMVISSHRAAEPGGGIERHPFALDREAGDEPSWYVVDLLLGGVRYTYGFSVDDQHVVDEWLYSYPHGRRRKIFQRAETEVSLGDALPKRELDLVADITEPNVLFLSVAARSRQGTVRPVFDWFAQRLRPRPRLKNRGYVLMGGREQQLARLLADPAFAERLGGLLREADLGIEGVEAVPVEDSVESRPRQRLSLLETEDWTVDDDRRPMRLAFVQRGRSGTQRLGLRDQSEGTRQLLNNAGQLLAALDHGRLLIIDEIDASLHPRITTHLVRLFQDPATNPHGAQLILTTHDASLLGRTAGEDILKRDQIWFVEKNRYGETTLFPLSDFKPRQEENRERRYLGGSYGAVPFLSDERFAAAVAGRGGAGSGQDSEA
jgi:hypothetical protein